MRYLNPQVFRELRFYFQFIVQRIFLPWGQLDVQYDSRLVLKGPASVLPYNINQANAAQR
ncbi:hypothetical protein J15TS10_27730 [Paenibacillus woosongensis]|uniref:Uncharacterized protein n=1 Tax=Paenibacillus woosongensis TaxID=307580 RepID=A0ABQ4MST0_9BACL|nr:hypothetical protein J15TS10_27730 [Paenibacillus woosongensis]